MDCESVGDQWPIVEEAFLTVDGKVVDVEAAVDADDKVPEAATPEEVVELGFEAFVEQEKEGEQVEHYSCD